MVAREDADLCHFARLFSARRPFLVQQGQQVRYAMRKGWSPSLLLPTWTIFGTNEPRYPVCADGCIFVILKERPYCALLRSVLLRGMKILCSLSTWILSLQDDLSSAISRNLAAAIVPFPCQPGSLTGHPALLTMPRRRTSIASCKRLISIAQIQSLAWGPGFCRFN